MTAHLVGQKGVRPRKVYTGNNPITGPEWKRARILFRYTQAEFGTVFGIHWNTVARRERGEQEFTHPAMARLAIQQHREDLRAGAGSPGDNFPISGAEWRVYREGLEMSPAEFGAAVDAHVSTVTDWEGDMSAFQHPNMARLAVRRLYNLKDIPFPRVRIRQVRII